ncbi:MAG: hypothetical protein HY927_04185 [Elusimicrobia bacterium]|nr:hypothetical protein [Elusimicrobiota bacterium]
MGRPLRLEERRRCEAELAGLTAPLRSARNLLLASAGCFLAVLLRLAPIACGRAPKMDPDEGIRWVILPLLGGAFAVAALVRWGSDPTRRRREVLREALESKSVQEAEGPIELASPASGPLAFSVGGRLHAWHGAPDRIPAAKEVVRVLYLEASPGAVDVRRLEPDAGWDGQDLRIFLEEQGVDFSPGDGREALLEKARGFMDGSAADP